MQQMAITLDDLYDLMQNETGWDGNDRQNQRAQIVNWLQSVLSIETLVEIIMNYFPLTIRCIAFHTNVLHLSRPIQFTQKEALCWHICKGNISHCQRVDHDVPISRLPNVMRLWYRAKNRLADPTTQTLRSNKRVYWKDGSKVWPSAICNLDVCKCYLIEKEVLKEEKMARFLQKLIYQSKDNAFQRGSLFSTDQEKKIYFGVDFCFLLQQICRQP